jgi:hypothetical protein
VRRIKVEKGKFVIPVEFELSKEKNKRRLHIKTPWMSQIQVADKDYWQVTTQQWFREKGKDKPYIPEGHIEIDGVLFKAVEGMNGVFGE